MYRRRTPALVNTSAATSRLMLDCLAIEEMRIMQVTVRAMQNPGSDLLAQGSERYRTCEILTEYDH